jgi:hypothetical protein
MEILFENV